MSPVSEQNPAVDRNVPEDYYMNYYCSAYIESVKWWFKNDLRITPEELASYFERVTSSQ